MAEDGLIAPVRDHLLRERRSLLDLSTRNRLLNTPVGPTRTRTVEVVDANTEAWAPLRKSEPLPPQEVQAALLAVADSNFGVAADEMFTAAARLFGFRATSAQLRAVLADGLPQLEADGRLALRHGIDVRPRGARTGYRPILSAVRRRSEPGPPLAG